MQPKAAYALKDGKARNLPSRPPAKQTSQFGVAVAVEAGGPVIANQLCQMTQLASASAMTCPTLPPVGAQAQHERLQMNVDACERAVADGKGGARFPSH
jgi:hypothetical protein